MGRTYKDTKKHKKKIAKTIKRDEKFIGGIGKIFKRRRRKDERAKSRQFIERVKQTLDDSDVPPPRFRKCDHWNYW